MTLMLVFLAASLGLVVFWVAARYPWPAPPAPVKRRTLLTPLEGYLQRELDRARLTLPARTLVNACLAAAALGVVVTYPFRNLLLSVIAMTVLGLIPLQAVRARIGARARGIAKATEPAIVQIAKLCEVRGHPFLALCDALPMLEPPLKAEFERALAETQAGAHLPDTLRELAVRCCNDFYLHQLAELVAIHIRQGGDLSGALLRLSDRMRTMDELRAEEAAELFGYKMLTRLLFLGGLAPLPYWALTKSTSLNFFLHNSSAQSLLAWVVLSGLAIATLPYWMAIED